VDHLKVFGNLRCLTKKVGLKANPADNDELLLSHPRSPLAAFKGLLVAALISMPFWGLLIFLMLRRK
jgi:hypothetical protein